MMTRMPTVSYDNPNTPQLAVNVEVIPSWGSTPASMIVTKSFVVQELGMH